MNTVARPLLGRSRISAVLATALVALAAVTGGAVFAPAVGAQTCRGSVSTSLESPTLPGGEWSVSDGCLPSDTFFEYSDGAVHAQAAISTVTYDDGHVGRVAVGILTLGTGIGLGVVGVEDPATGLVKWSAVLGDYEQIGATASVAGAGVTLLPTEAAGVAVAISGTGTDITTQLKDAIASTTTTAPSALNVPSDGGQSTTTAPPELTPTTSPATTIPVTVPPTTIPETVQPADDSPG